MKVSLLNEKILFQKNAVVSDVIGNRKNAWEDYYLILPRLVARVETRNQKQGRQ